MLVINPSLILAILSLNPELTTAVQAQNPNDFLNAVKKNFSDLENAYPAIQAKGVLAQEIVRPDGTVGSKKYALDYFKTSKFRKIVRYDHSTDLNLGANDFFEEVDYIDEPQRLFVVMKNSGGSPYSLKHLGVRDADIERNLRRYLNYFEAPFLLYSENVVEFISSPCFKLKQFTENTSLSEDIIRVDFDYIPGSDGNPIPQGVAPFTGWFTLSGANGWAVREYRMGQGNSIFSGSVEYSTMTGGIPKPILITKSMHASNGSKSNYSFKVEQFDLKSTPLDHFSLSHYGLGDAEQPPGASPNRSPYWFFGIAFLAIIVSIALRRYGGQ